MKEGAVMDLWKFYTEKVNENDYYYKFKDLVYSADNYFAFTYFDTSDIIKRFRDLCMPTNTHSNSENIEFILICYYLKVNGFYIKQFPNIIERPTRLGEFSYDCIRDFIHSRDNYSGTVTWAERRKLVNELEFIKKDNFQQIEEELSKKIQMISTRGAEFDNMTLEERLKELSNLLENMLKINGKFINVDYANIFLGYITEDNVKEYRKIIHCFRHATEEALNERNLYTNEQKKFLIDYVIVIANHIHLNK